MENNFLSFKCAGIKIGERFPIEYTGRGENISPEFVIYNLSDKAKTLAVILEDMSHPIKNFTHWLIWNIPAAEKIMENIPAGKSVPALGDAKQGIVYGLHRYAGPKPPKGTTHIYQFTIYALDCILELKANSMKKAFLKKAEAHILQKGSITGRFE